MLIRFPIQAEMFPSFTFVARPLLLLPHYPLGTSANISSCTRLKILMVSYLVHHFVSMKVFLFYRRRLGSNGWILQHLHRRWGSKQHGCTQ
jgi:hypothetical protein